MSIKSTRTLKRSDAEDMYRTLLKAQLDNIDKLSNEQLGDALDDFYEFDNFLVESDENDEHSSSDASANLAYFYR